MANQAAAAARGAVKAAIQKWGRTFTGETNGEMLDLITKLHESEGEKDFEGVVGVERGARYGGVDERQRLDVSLDSRLLTLDSCLKGECGGGGELTFGRSTIQLQGGKGKRLVCRSCCIFTVGGWCLVIRRRRRCFIRILVCMSVLPIPFRARGGKI